MNKKIVALMASGVLSISSVAVIAKLSGHFDLSAKAEIVNGTVTFEREMNGEFAREDRENYVFATKGTTGEGTDMYLYTESQGLRNPLKSSQVIASLPCAEDYPNFDEELYNYEDLTPVEIVIARDTEGTPFEFQKIDSIAINLAGGVTRTLGIAYSEDGASWSYYNAEFSGGAYVTFNQVRGAKYVKLINAWYYDVGYDYFAIIDNYLSIKGVKVNYTCSTDGELPVKALDSIAVTTPATKTEFTVGDTFNSDGLVVTATYTNGDQDVVIPVVTAPDMSTAGTKEVEISYTEKEVTKTTSYEITVSEPVSRDDDEVAGVYVDDRCTTEEKMRKLTLNEDGTGQYYFRNKVGTISDTIAIENITWSVSGSTITFTLVSYEGTAKGSTFGSYRLFSAGAVGDTHSGSLTENGIEITLANSGGYTEAIIVFAKQS